MKKSKILNPNKVGSLYIHTPFCKKKCDYCDFVSYAGKESLIDQYVDNIIKEIHCLDFGSLGVARDAEPVEAFFNLDLNTIYIGGGTPTLLEPKHFDKILSTIICHLSLDICHSEISVEANPATADREKLKALRELGVNRLSIGAQSFNDRHLKTLGRVHNSADILRFYDDARSAGFNNINLDLIFAIPGQTLADWEDDLRKAIHMAPEHLSAYNLTPEENTPLYEEMTNEDLEAEMFEYTITTLTSAGYRHYEISNFAKPGFECRHNINYWKNGNYLGIGAGAHSHLNGKRWANPNSIEGYIGCGCAARNVSRRTSDDSSRATDRRETIFLGLRLTEGLPSNKFQGFESETKELINEGLLQRNNGHYHLTRRGIMLGNRVFERFV